MNQIHFRLFYKTKNDFPNTQRISFKHFSEDERKTRSSVEKP